MRLGTSATGTEAPAWAQMAPLPRPRIGLVSVRFNLFDAQMPPGFPDRMRAHARRSAEILGRSLDVVETGVIEDEDQATAAADRLRRERLDAIVFAPAMAAPPSYAAIVLAASEAPLVIWNAPSIQRLPGDLSQAEATEHSTTVGSVMYANVRVREGRPPIVVTAGHDDEAALGSLLRTVRAAAAAGSLRGANVLRVGEPIPGYLDVDASGADLALLGLREVSVALDEWQASVSAIPTAQAAALVESLALRGWPGDPGPNAVLSGQVALALQRHLATAHAIGGTVNCHGPFFRWSKSVGITACLGVACATEAGRPLACTGDQPTGILLYLARAMAGAALYCECYTPEAETGFMLLAAGGEGDPAWADPSGRVTLEANDHYPGERGAGTSVAFGLRQGPATLLSLSPGRGGWVLAWATGEIVESRYAHMRGPNGMFRFDSGPAPEAASRWLASGATHHNALAPGRLDLEVPALAAAMGIRAVRV